MAQAHHGSHVGFDRAKEAQKRLLRKTLCVVLSLALVMMFAPGSFSARSAFAVDDEKANSTQETSQVNDGVGAPVDSQTGNAQKDPEPSTPQASEGDRSPSENSLSQEQTNTQEVADEKNDAAGNDNKGGSEKVGQAKR